MVTLKCFLLCPLSTRILVWLNYLAVILHSSTWRLPLRFMGVIRLLNQLPIFDWCVGRLGSQNKHHINTFSNEIGLYLGISINYSTFNNEHNRDDLCIQFKDQETCIFDSQNLIRKGPIFNAIFAYASSQICWWITKFSLCKSNQ